MATHSMANLMRTVLALAVVGQTIAPFAAPATAQGLNPGDDLDKSTAAQAEGTMPPELLPRYKDGKFENKIVAWPPGYRWETSFQEATLGNKGKYELHYKGTIIDKATNEQPNYVYGLPFPDVDPNDPQVAAKILWNAYYAYWYQ